MRRIRATEFPTPALIAIIVLGHLLFSVGDGLRLTPFHSNALGDEISSGQVSVHIPPTVTISRMNPMELVNQVRIGDKRSSVHLDLPPVGGAGSPSFFHYLIQNQSLHSAQTRPLRSSAGRAPPVAIHS